MSHEQRRQWIRRRKHRPTARSSGDRPAPRDEAAKWEAATRTLGVEKWTKALAAGSAAARKQIVRIVVDVVCDKATARSGEDLLGKKKENENCCRYSSIFGWFLLVVLEEDRIRVFLT